MEITVRQTNIKPNLVKHLMLNGIVLVSHLQKLDVRRLAAKTRLSLEECEQILGVIKPKRPHYILRASELMVKPFERISTLYDELDDILGGGIRCGQLTELSGPAGAGKSNFCSQLGTYVLTTSDSDVLLIHTEGQGKLKLCIKRFTTLAATLDREDLVQKRLHVMNCGNEFELIEIVNRLPDILAQKPTVKVIIIDSMTCAFISSHQKPDPKFFQLRNLRLSRLVKDLHQITWDHRVATIVTNHVSYDPNAGENRPALGRIWSSMCQTRIYLDKKGDHRFARVNKGAVKSPTRIKFDITNDLLASILLENDD